MPRAYPNLVAYEQNNRMDASSASNFTHDHCFDPRGILTASESSDSSTTTMTTPMQTTSSISDEYSPSTAEFYNSYAGSENLMSFDDDILLPVTPNRPTEAPSIRILVQPEGKFRFRYLKELRRTTHEKLCGSDKRRQNHASDRAIYPTVQIINCPYPRAIIRCTLVTADDEIHPNCLCKERGVDLQNYIDADPDEVVSTAHFTPAERQLRKRFDFDPFYVEVAREADFVAEFSNYGVIKSKKPDAKKELVRKMILERLCEIRMRSNNNGSTSDVNISRGEILQMNIEAARRLKGETIDFNVLSLCFQGFYRDSNDILRPLTEKVYSSVIKDSTNAKTGLLKLCRISKTSGSCLGNDEVWLLVDKVDKNNIEVKFYELDDEDESVLWEADGVFDRRQDVFRQFAIVLRTPPYKNVNIETRKEVYIRLERTADGETSNRVKFCYNPAVKAANGKRMRSDVSSELTEYIVPVINSPLVSSTTEQQQQQQNTDDLMEVNEIPIQLEEFLYDKSSEEFETMIKDIKGVGDFLRMKSMAETRGGGDSNSSSSMIVHDSATSCANDDKCPIFAKDIFARTLIILKEFESHSISRSNAVSAIHELLRERSSYENTLLHSALYAERYKIVDVILWMIEQEKEEFKDVVDLVNEAGKTALQLAVAQNQLDIVRALLELGADPTLCDNNDENSLHLAVLAKATDCVHEILASSSSHQKTRLDLEAYTQEGWTALQIAAKRGSTEIVKALSEAGADANSIDLQRGGTALHAASEADRKDVVDYLLMKSNVDVDAENFDGETALECAKGERIVQMLTKRVGNDDDKVEDNVADVIDNLAGSTAKLDSKTEALNIVQSEVQNFFAEADETFDKTTDLMRDQILQQMRQLTLAQADNEKLLCGD